MPAIYANTDNLTRIQTRKKWGSTWTKLRGVRFFMNGERNKVVAPRAVANRLNPGIHATFYFTRYVGEDLIYAIYDGNELVFPQKPIKKARRNAAFGYLLFLPAFGIVATIFVGFLSIPVFIFPIMYLLNLNSLSPPSVKRLQEVIDSNPPKVQEAHGHEAAEPDTVTAEGKESKASG